MIKRNNKKGFTIVELVIVIAVIAILAAVLIPTFTGIIKKANLSADMQAVRQMNTVIAAEAKDLNTNEAILALSSAGYNAEKTLIPVTKNHAFFYVEAENSVVLVNLEDNKIVYPEKFEGTEVPAGSVNLVTGLSNFVVSDAESLVAALSTASVTGGKNVYVSASVTLTEKVEIPYYPTIVLQEGAKIDAPELVFEQGGTITGEGTITSNIIVEGNAPLTINKYASEVGSVKFVAKDASKPLFSITSMHYNPLNIVAGEFTYDNILASFDYAGEKGETIMISGGTFNTKNYLELTAADFSNCTNDPDYDPVQNWGDGVVRVFGK